MDYFLTLHGNEKYFSFLTALLLTGLVSAQTTFTGQVTNEKNEPLAGVNVFIQHTYDGASTDAEGRFSLQTTAKGQVVLVASFMGYETVEKSLETNTATSPIIIRLKEKANELNTVVIAAGSFEASDEKKMTVLKPLDIVTTASTNADIYATIQTLPGATRVGEEEGLFVRGGAASEAKTVIDQMVVENPFFSQMPDIPQRGRFSPFLFNPTPETTRGLPALSR